MPGTCDKHSFAATNHHFHEDVFITIKKEQGHKTGHDPVAAGSESAGSASEKRSRLFTDGSFSLLIPELQRAVADKKYTTPTPIQEQAIAPLLAGRDLLGSAQTGTGKTAAFVLPMLQLLNKQPKTVVAAMPRVLILAPTRELASQIGDSIGRYGRHLHISRTVIFGGIKQHRQVESLKVGKDIVVATPGRLLDLMNQGHISLNRIDIFVLDEADRMLDMGFLPDVRRIITKLPKNRQTMFFSATFAPEISALARELLTKPVEISISPEAPAVDVIDQKVYFVDKPNKIHLLVQLLSNRQMSKVLVFTKMKHTAGRLAQKLCASQIRAEAIHGDKAQNARERALDSFKSGQVRVLVATDIAARGIDVKAISHVFNYDLPAEPQTYIHRIGRTARAGKKGDAISFCMAEERNILSAIEKTVGKPIPVVTDHLYHSAVAQNASGAAARPKPRTVSPHEIAKRSRERLTKKIAYGGIGKSGAKRRRGKRQS